MRLTAYQVMQLLADLEGMVKRDDSVAMALTLWLRDRQDDAIHIYQESTVMDWKERNPLVEVESQRCSYCSFQRNGCDDINCPRREQRL